MANHTSEALQDIGLTPELVALLRRRAHRRGMSIEQALSLFLANGLACDRRRSDTYRAVSEGPGIDAVMDALDGRR